MPARVLLFTLVLTTPLMAKAGDLVELLQTRKCPDCQLTDVDLVHSDLRDADLRGAQLQRANLGHARLDGADLKKSNLQFTNLRGASLRGADLRGSTLYGTDLRQADLSGARLDDGALEQAYWQGAHGIKDSVRSHAALHTPSGQPTTRCCQQPLCSQQHTKLVLFTSINTGLRSTSRRQAKLNAVS